jgi:tRNA nucleotidyltransferase/poly(A) polymerase
VNLPANLLGDWQREALHAISTAAVRTGSTVYLVGGPVRDLLRGIPLGDLDLAVDGNALSLVTALTESLHAEVTANQMFLTWKVTLGATRHLDFAQIRTETYAHPGALPAVRPAHSIEEDLARRDFTVNAMAIRLDDQDLIDPFAGRDDLRAGTLRVLHDQSFSDDPTRIFRALRLANRCGLTLEPGTATRLDEALRAGAVDCVARERAWKEMDLACKEKHPVPVVRSFAERGCLTSMLGVSGSSGLALVPDDLVVPRDLDPRVVLIGALLRERGGNQPPLPFDQSTIARIHAIATSVPSLAVRLASEISTDAKFSACESASPEERFLAAAEGRESAAVIARFDETSPRRLGLRGDELGVSQGPWIGQAIRETRRALFAGSIEAREAPAFARRLAMQYLND